jgi:Predicted integral membrane protein (DUF2270)
VSYLSKLSIHPEPIASIDQLWARAAVGPVPGQVVLALGTVFYLGLLALGLATLHGQRAVGRPHASKPETTSCSAWRRRRCTRAIPDEADPHRTVPLLRSWGKIALVK